MPWKRREFFFLGSVGIIAFGLQSCMSAVRATKKSIFTLKAEKNTIKPKSDLLLRFVSVADTGTGDRGQFAVANAMAVYHMQNPYDLVVLAGDNIYNNGEIKKINAVFERPYARLLRQGVKFQAVLGNHDIRTDNGNPQLEYPGFNMKGRYYTYSRDSVQFFALDTNGNADWNSQMAWLEKELANSKAAWKIVYGHHPIYASGFYGSNPQFIKRFTPLFQKYGVQLYINGHEHHYERTRSINGTTYLICGAGASYRPVGKNEWTEYATTNLSFAAYEVYPDRIELSGIGTNSRVFDKGIIPLKSA